MIDLEIKLNNQPGALAAMGEALGKAGVSVEGGGAWLCGDAGVAHFLVAAAEPAGQLLAAAGIEVLASREVLVQRLNQDEPGQLGKLTRRMAEAGVNIEVLYSDHNHQLVLVVDDPVRGQQVSQQWEAERAARVQSAKAHHYALGMEWTGSDGVGTQSYRSYRRDFTLTAPGKMTIEGSSDPAFRGDPGRYNPEELLVASLSSCHMLTYLHLCAVNKVVVLAYEDAPTGRMRETSDGSTGAFEEVTLRPTVTVASDSMRETAAELHHQAHALCFIARSVNFPVTAEPSIQVSGQD
jgi:organic hydroperoxide reductase OsmC/OhrA